MSIQLIIIIYLFYYIPYILLDYVRVWSSDDEYFLLLTDSIHLRFFTPLISFTIFIQAFFFSLPFNPIEIDE